MSDPAGVAAPSRPRATAAWYIAPLLTAPTVALRLPAFFASRHLSYGAGVGGCWGLPGPPERPPPVAGGGRRPGNRRRARGEAAAATGRVARRVVALVAPARRPRRDRCRRRDRGLVRILAAVGPEQRL